MGSEQVLLISSHSVFAEAISRILQEAGIQVSARADSLESALPLLQEYQSDVIIAVGEEAGLSDAELLSLLNRSGGDGQIILISLAHNWMIVHHRQQVMDVTPADLISVLRRGSGRSHAGVET